MEDQRHIYEGSETDHDPETKLIWALLFCRPEEFEGIDLKPEEFKLWTFVWGEMMERNERGVSVSPQVELYDKKFDVFTKFAINTDGWATVPEMKLWALQIRNRYLIKMCKATEDPGEKMEYLTEVKTVDQLTNAKDPVDEYADWYCDRREKQESGALGFKTGIRWIDERVCLDRKQLVTVGGRPSNGKSAFALNMAIGMAHHGHKVLFLSLEMSANENFNRAISCATGKNFNDIEHARVDDIYAYIAQYIEYTGKNLNIVDMPSSTSPADVRRMAKGYDVIVVDQLSNLDIGETKETKASRVSDACYHLLRTAQSENALVILCAQINRQGDQEPRLINLKESGGIEEASSKVIFVHRPDLEDSETWISCPKNRNGKAGIKIKMNFNFEKMRFNPLHRG